MKSTLSIQNPLSVVVLHCSTTCVEHHLGELVSYHGIVLSIHTLQDIDMNVLDHHKNHENQSNSRFGTILPMKPIFN
jgi:hypothetical protein